MVVLPTAQPPRRWYRIPRPVFVFLLTVAGWALLAVVAGPARADSGHAADGPPGVASIAHLAAEASATHPGPGTHRPPLGPVLVGAAQVLPEAVGHGLAPAARLPEAAPAIGLAVAEVAPGHRATPSAPDVEPAAGAGPADHPAPAPATGPPSPAPAAAPLSSGPVADAAPVPAGGGAAQVGRNAPAPALPRPHAPTPAQAPAELGALSVPDPLRGQTPPLPAEPEAPTPTAPGSCHASGGPGHADSVEAAGSAAPMLARVRYVPDTGLADDDMGAVFDPGSRPD